MIILSIDQATKLSGYSIYDTDTDKFLTTNIINVSNSKQPLSDYRQEIINLIGQWKPNLMIWENLKSNRNADVIRKLGMFTGVLQEVAETYKIDWTYYIPTSVKAKVALTKTGPRGHATKQDVAKRICYQYNMTFPPDAENDNEHSFLNITDSMALSLYHTLYSQYDIKVKKKRKKRSKLEVNRSKIISNQK